jgi:Ceramidase
VQNGRIIPLFFLALTSLLAVFAMNPIGQDPSYHLFADRRQFLGIPNFANVVSNIPFLLIGLFGLRLCCQKQTSGAKLSWMVVFLSVALVALGSAYYHWNPNDKTLFWDRLPMTAGFMGLAVAVASEHVDRKIEVLALPLALAVGIGSLLWWALYNDLRFYGWIQFISLAVVAVILALFPAAYSHRYFLAVGLGFYLIAKFAETYDAAFFAATGKTLAGHALKHLLAAAAVFSIYLMLRNRRQLPR